VAELRRAKKSDLSAILELQNRLAPARRKMPVSILDDSLFSFSHRQGEYTALFLEREKLRGVCGWVRGENGEFFGSPFFCEDAVSGEALMGRLLEEARGAKWIRVSCFPEEVGKRAALEKEGFRPEFEFVEFEVFPKEATLPTLPEGIIEFPLASANVAEFRDLMNQSFADVDNSLPVSESNALELLTGADNDPSLCLGWRSEAGRLLAFVIVDKFGYVDSIGISPAAQGRGYGSVLYGRVLALVAKSGGSRRLFTTVSSRNKGSIALHRRLKIPEVERRIVFQKSL
jgi:ribosomal protein S18 acetylase RimI-like enzyme